MTAEQQSRIVHSWLSHLRVEVIARMENVPAADVERVVAKAVGVPARELRLRS